MRQPSLYVSLVLTFLPATALPSFAQQSEMKEIVSKTFPTLKLIQIPAKGRTFTMGAPKGEPGQLRSETPHEVTLSEDFYLGVTPVTRGQFAAFVKDTGYKTDPEKGGQGYGWDQAKKSFEGGGKYSWRNPGYAQADEHPVVKTSWNDARAFCKWLGEKDGQEYGLPTEAQWEFACRAGSRTRYSFGDDVQGMAKHANVADAKFREVTGMKWGIKENDGYAFTAPVGQYQKNAFGLQDMHGNVMQWCSDVFGDYPDGAITDPQGPPAKAGSFRVLRGGCWRNAPIYGRSASRKNGEPDDAGETVSFRLAVPVR
ncbi:MAG TPA: formylglycine-generating enzyme family protein [Pirellulales bacterium]|jgi:formylglycine-generating enzyme required for sulfatase activity|nr:formylglycine-generating enzyme family protein [Pirellulales bacterium]